MNITCSLRWFDTDERCSCFRLHRKLSENRVTILDLRKSLRAIEGDIMRSRCVLRLVSCHGWTTASHSSSVLLFYIHRCSHINCPCSSLSVSSSISVLTSFFASSHLSQRLPGVIPSNPRTPLCLSPNPSPFIRSTLPPRVHVSSPTFFGNELVLIDLLPQLLHSSLPSWERLLAVCVCLLLSRSCHHEWRV